MTGDSAGNNPIRIMATVEEPGRPRRRISITIDADLADMIAKGARLGGITQGELIEQAIDSGWRAPLGTGAYRLQQHKRA